MRYTSHAEDFVKDFYTSIGICEIQQLNIQEVAKKAGIKVFYWDKPSQAVYLDDYTCILLNCKISLSQQWQDFNHELGHLILHVGDQRKMPKSFRDYQEYKANSFMYHACIPTFMLNDLNIINFSHQSVLQVQKLFNVEYKFALKRLQQYLNNKLSSQHGMVYFSKSF